MALNYLLHFEMANDARPPTNALKTAKDIRLTVLSLQRSMLAQFARHLRNQRAARARGEDVGEIEVEEDENGRRIVLPEDCQVQ